MILSDYFYLGRSVSNRCKSVRCAQVSPLKSKKVHGTLDILPAPQGDTAFESYGTSQGSRELGHTSCCEVTCFISQHEAQGTDGGRVGGRRGHEVRNHGDGQTVGEDKKPKVRELHRGQLQELTVPAQLRSLPRDSFELFTPSISPANVFIPRFPPALKEQETCT